jgi:hypothetical protein
MAASLERRIDMVEAKVEQCRRNSRPFADWTTDELREEMRRLKSGQEPTPKAAAVIQLMEAGHGKWS